MRRAAYCALCFLAGPLSAAPLAWEDLAQLCIDHHPDIRASQFELQNATGIRITAASIISPRLDVEAYTIPPLANIDLRQPIYRRGALAALRASEFGIAAAHAAYERACEDTLYDLRLAYLELLFLQRKQELLSTHVRTLHDALERTRSFFTAGQSHRSDIEALAVRLQLAGQNLIDVETLLAQRRLDVTQLCGLPAGDPTLAEGIAGSLNDLPDPPADLTPWIADSLKNRPDLRLLRALDGVEEGRVILAGASAYPQVTLYGRGELTPGAPFLKELTQRIDEYGDQFSQSRALFGTEMRWRLIDGGQALGAVRIARAVRLQQRELLAATERALPGQIQLSASALRQARSLLDALPKAEEFPAQRQSTLDAWDRQDIRPTELYKMLEDLLALETAQLQARLDGSLASTALRRATGSLVAWSLNTPPTTR